MKTDVLVHNAVKNSSGSSTAYQFTSTLNSTMVALASGASFVGTAETTPYNDIGVVVSTDKEGILTIDLSTDGGATYSTSLTYKYTPGFIFTPVPILKFERHFRISFENTSADTQGSLDITTYSGNYRNLSAPINSLVAQNFDATVVRPTDYFSEVAMGKRQGRTLWNKFGYNQNLDTGTEVIASWGGTFTPLTTATTLIIASSSVNDTNGGTGCNSIVVYGIDANRDEVIEVITLTGTTSVVTTSTWLGINRVAMFLCGTSQVNEGEINIIATTGGSTMAQMPTGGGVTQQCIFHIPQNHNFITEWLFINLLNRGKNAELTIKLWVYSAVSNGKQEVFSVDIDTANFIGELALTPKLPFPISEKTVMWIEATSDKDDIVVNARFSGVLERIN